MGGKLDLRTAKFHIIGTSEPAPEVGSISEKKDTLFIKQVSATEFEVYASDDKGKVVRLEKGVNEDKLKELLLNYITENVDEIKRVLNIQETGGSSDDFGAGAAEFFQTIMSEIEKLKPVSYGSLISEIIGERPNEAFVKLTPVKSGGLLSLLIEVFNSNLLVGQKLSLGNQSHYDIPVDMTIETMLGTVYMKKNGDVDFLVKYGEENERVRTSVQFMMSQD